MIAEHETATPLSQSGIDPDRLLKRGVAEIIVEEELRARLESGQVLRLKQGFDPTRPDLHLGHAVGLRKLRLFQQLGHRVVLIVGDWTAQIGDPSGRSTQRTMLSAEEVQQNAQRYLEQFFRVVDPKRTEVRWQSEWFGKFKLDDVYQLMARFTVAQLLEREDFTRRFQAGEPIGLVELLYPLLQAYDSVAIEADVEFGGTDQKFNILTGRELQRMVGQEPQDVYLVKMIQGLDGATMSKTRGNYIPLTAPAEEMYSLVMSMADEVMPSYFESLTDVPEEEIAELFAAIRRQALNPMVVKKRLAWEITAEFHSPEAADRAQEHFERVFQRRERPTEVAEVVFRRDRLPMELADLVREAGFATSRSEAKRLVEQGAVDLDGVTLRNPRERVSPPDGALIKVGQARFRRIRLV